MSSNVAIPAIGRRNAGKEGQQTRGLLSSHLTSAPTSIDCLAAERPTAKWASAAFVCCSATDEIAASIGTTLLLRRRAEIEGPPVAPGTMVAAIRLVLVALLNYQTFTGAGSSGVSRLDIKGPWCYRDCLAQWFSEGGPQTLWNPRRPPWGP